MHFAGSEREIYGEIQELFEFTGISNAGHVLRRAFAEATSFHSDIALRTRTATIATPTDVITDPRQATKNTQRFPYCPIEGAQVRTPLTHRKDSRPKSQRMQTLELEQMAGR